MRLWHKDLIRVLPKQQLVSQWRECIAVARNIEIYGFPRHGLVNKVSDYPASHLYTYTDLVVCELFNRGYKVSPIALKKFEDTMNNIDTLYADEEVPFDDLFFMWHTKDYLVQCYYNLQEKFDCDIISHYEWARIERYVGERYSELV